MSVNKSCPLLVQSDTSPSLTTPGMSWTRTYMLECQAEKCAAYDNGKCVHFGVDVCRRKCVSVQIEVAGAGIVSLEYSNIKVNQRDLVQELKSELENMFDLETDYSGNFAGSITLTLELLGDCRKKEVQLC